MVVLTACSSPEPKGPENGPDAAEPTSAQPDGGAAADSGGTDDVATLLDAASPDLPTQPAYCDVVTSEGFFPTCEACDDNGLDCDSIEAPTVSGRACGCSGGCPCGLRCGSYEIGPGVVVSSICVR